MKKIKILVSIIAIFSMASGCFGFSSFSASAADEEYTIGDINSDGSINSLDSLIALQASVDSVTLTALQKKAADVNLDNTVNSEDALIILNYSTGIADSISANDVLIDMYISAASKANTEIPGYRLKTISDTYDAYVMVSIPTLLYKQENSDLEKELNDTDITTSKTMTQASANAKNYLPLNCTASELKQAIKSISYKNNNDGTWTVVFNLIDETNPKTATTKLGKVITIQDYDTIAKGFNTSSDDATTTLNSLTVKYSSCSVTCTINSSTNQFVSYEESALCTLTSNITMVATSMSAFKSYVDTNYKLSSVYNYSNFVY